MKKLAWFIIAFIAIVAFFAVFDCGLSSFIGEITFFKFIYLCWGLFLMALSVRLFIACEDIREIRKHLIKDNEEESLVEE